MKKSKTNPELKNIIEAALLVAGEPLTPERLVALFPEGSRPTKDEVKAAVESLTKDYQDRGIEIRQIEKGWRIQTREKYAPYVAKAVEARPPRYTRALLETLAIIAYRQPVTRGDIEEIRGVAVSTETIRTLHDREWVREVGRREVPGRPVLYGTTRQFLEHFNLKSLEDLPPLSELRPIEEVGAELDKRLAQSGGELRPAPATDDLPPASDDEGGLSAEPAAMEASPPNHRGE